MKLLNRVRKSLTRISPELNTKLTFLLRKKRLPNFGEGMSFDDKITWLKLYSYPTDVLVAQCADKLEVRKYIKNKGREEILNELYGSYKEGSEIDFSELPESFVLKWNNDFGSTIIVKNKSDENLDLLVQKIDSKKDESFYLLGAEMHYKLIKPMIVCEKYLEEPSQKALTDYKFYCYHGEPKFVMVCIGRKNSRASYYFYDLNWNLMRINSDGLNAPKDFVVDKPKNFNEMLTIAKELSEDFKFVRVDLYNLLGKIIFGEMTFTPASGSDARLSRELDLFLSEGLIIK